MAERWQNFAGGLTTDDPLLSSATTINSSGFSALPVIEAPYTMTLVLDPDGDEGLPEIVTVTAHASTATSVTVVRGREQALGGSPGRQHPQGTVWIVAASARAHGRADSHVGDIKTSILDADHGTWLFLDPAGRAIPDADTIWPALWAEVPASWQSGTTLNLPPVDGAVLMAGGTLGATGGSDTVELDVGQLPAHVHSIEHDHAPVNTASAGAHTHTVSGTAASAGGHSHTINHGHTASSSNDGVHSHIVSARSSSTPGSTQSVMGASTSGGTYTIGTGNSVAHNHPISVASHSGSSGSAGAHTHSVSGTAASDGAHSHSVDLPNFVGDSSSVGDGDPIDIAPIHLRVNFFIKAA